MKRKNDFGCHFPPRRSDGGSGSSAVAALPPAEQAKMNVLKKSDVSVRDSGAFLFVCPSGAKLPRAARQGRANKQHSVSADPPRLAGRPATRAAASANRNRI